MWRVSALCNSHTQAQRNSVGDEQNQKQKLYYEVQHVGNKIKTCKMLKRMLILNRTMLNMQFLRVNPFFKQWTDREMMINKNCHIC